MNERIRDLAEQCRCEDWIDYELFAELIVRECIGVVEDSDGYNQYFPHVTENIKQHFGVE